MEGKIRFSTKVNLCTINYFQACEACPRIMTEVFPQKLIQLSFKNQRMLKPLLQSTLNFCNTVSLTYHCICAHLSDGNFEALCIF